jgi:pyruvate/2-oxoglutarate dehydrogenase complex dihydrolipoamide dehydrogenase (E3) component
MQHDYDMLVIGMGPAGMALSAMGTAMGLKVLGIEKDKIGGECLNTGCVPSKALLKTASVRHTIAEVEKYGLEKTAVPDPQRPFERIEKYRKYINEEKTLPMFEKMDVIQLCASSSANSYPRHGRGSLKHPATENGPSQSSSEVAGCVFR